MLIPRVPTASVLLLFAAAFTSVTSAQTTFSPQYAAFSQQPNSIEPPPSPILQADLNRDGIPDFIATQDEQVLLSSAGGKYTVHHFSSSALVGGALPLVAGDFNGDGKNDVLFYAFTGGNQLFVVAYGDGAGNFPTTKAVPNLPGFVTGGVGYVLAQTTDVNGDGRPDLILADLVGANGEAPNITINVRLYLNNGNGFTDKGNIYSYVLPAGSQGGVPWDDSPALDLLLGDYDSDGHADVALRFLYTSPQGPSDSNLFILYGDGAAHFTAKAVYTHRPSEIVFSAADMNDDGRTDLVGADVDQTIHTFRSNAGRTFSESVMSVSQLQQSYYNYPPLLADFDGNGQKDIGFVAAFFGPTSSQFGFQAEYQTPSHTWQLGSFSAVDTFATYFGSLPFIAYGIGGYNHDGKPDVALFTDDSSAQTHPNSADLLLNTGTKSVGNCAPPVIGINVCSPGTSSASPVKFSFSATSFYPIRKMEVWVDGAKKSETYHVVANQGFSDVSLTLAKGKHTVSFFSGGFDGSVVKKTVTVQVP
jgi:hypothetical protein